MQCPACKKENANNNKFCNHCGYDLVSGGTGGPVDISSADTMPFTAQNAGTQSEYQVYGAYANQKLTAPSSNHGSGSQTGKNKTIIIIACISLLLIAGAVYFYKFMDRGDKFVGTWQKVGSSSVVVISKNDYGFNFHDYDGDHNASYSGGKLLVAFKEGQATAIIDQDDQMILALYGISETYKRSSPGSSPEGDTDVVGPQNLPDVDDDNGNDDKDTDTSSISGKTIPAYLAGGGSEPSRGSRWDRVSASSALAPQGSSSYEPDNVLDSNNSTAWVEGSADAGLDEWIELGSGTTQKVSSIQISNGYDKSNAVFYANNRVQRVRLDFSNGTYIYSTLLDGYGAVSQIDLGQAIKTKSLRITILGVYQGTEYNDTCISEIRSY